MKIISTLYKLLFFKTIELYTLETKSKNNYMNMQTTKISST